LRPFVPPPFFCLLAVHQSFARIPKATPSPFVNIITTQTPLPLNSPSSHHAPKPPVTCGLYATPTRRWLPGVVRLVTPFQVHLERFASSLAAFCGFGRYLGCERPVLEGLVARAQGLSSSENVAVLLFDLFPFLVTTGDRSVEVSR